MSALIDVVEEQREPLLRESSPPPPPLPSKHSSDENHEIVPFTSSDGPDPPPPNPADQNQRLVSLDVFRGLTIAVRALIPSFLSSLVSISPLPVISERNSVALCFKRA